MTETPRPPVLLTPGQLEILRRVDKTGGWVHGSQISLWEHIDALSAALQAARAERDALRVTFERNAKQLASYDDTNDELLKRAEQAEADALAAKAERDAEYKRGYVEGYTARAAELPTDVAEARRAAFDEAIAWIRHNVGQKHETMNGGAIVVILETVRDRPRPEAREE